MNTQFSSSRALLCSGVLAFVMSPAYADPACDTEVAAIQAELAAPADSVSHESLEQARQMFKILKEDCNGGTPFEAVAPIAEQIRSLLGMGDAS